MKKFFALLLALAMMLALAACGSNTGWESGEVSETSTPVEIADESGSTAGVSSKVADSITLWTYPIGDWGNETVVNELTAAFQAETGISVTVEYLNYTDGDDKVNTAISAGRTPDLIMEGPERLVALWGKMGYLVDLSDMLDDEDNAELYDVVMAACTTEDGAVYEYPLVMIAHCMAINYTAFQEARADQYVDIESHTWTTQDFKNAVAALYDTFGGTVGAIYCNGQGGDQGTRAILNNLYGGTFTNASHTAYTWTDEENIRALQELYDMEGIHFDASIVGSDEISLFRNGTLKISFYWNIAQQLNTDYNDAGLTNNGDEIVFMSFPSPTGEAKLCGGIWGFGVFDNGDDAKIATAKEFIQYMCDSQHTADAVRAASYFPVRDTAEGADLTNIWADHVIMNEYAKLMPYLGDYYQISAGWAEARTAWWNMLQEIGAGKDIATTVATYCGQANATADG